MRSRTALSGIDSPPLANDRRRPHQRGSSGQTYHREEDGRASREAAGSRCALLIGYQTEMPHPVGFIEPCLPTNARSVPSGPQWVYEIKHDGFRFVCWRAGEPGADRVPLIAEAISGLRVKSVVVDGEGVVCRPDGVSDFDRLRAGCRERSCTLSICWSLTGPICAASHGTRAVRGWRACCGRPGKVCGCPSTSTALREKWCFITLAAWVWKASSPNAATGRIGPGAARIGSR
jgi:hypothetical protein